MCNAIDAGSGQVLEWDTATGATKMKDGKHLALLVQRKHAERFLLPADKRKVAEIRSTPVKFLFEGDQLMLVSTGKQGREAVAILEYQNCSRIKTAHFSKYEALHCVTMEEFDDIRFSWKEQDFCWAWHFELRARIEPPLPIPLIAGPEVWMWLSPDLLAPCPVDCATAMRSDSFSGSSGGSYPATTTESSEDAMSVGSRLVVRLSSSVIKNLSEEQREGTTILVAFSCRPGGGIWITESGYRKMGAGCVTQNFAGKAIVSRCKELRRAADLRSSPAWRFTSSGEKCEWKGRFAEGKKVFEWTLCKIEMSNQSIPLELHGRGRARTEVWKDYDKKR